MIPEAVLLDALQAVHTGRLRVHEAYRTIRAAETVTNPIDAQLIKSARRRISVLYMAQAGGETAALDLRLAIDELNAVLNEAAS